MENSKFVLIHKKWIFIVLAFIVDDFVMLYAIPFIDTLITFRTNDLMLRMSYFVMILVITFKGRQETSV